MLKRRNFPRPFSDNTSIHLFVIFMATISLGYTQSSVTRPKHETAILDKRASFECSVKSPNAAEVEIWWQFQNENVTSQISDSHKITVNKESDGTVRSELTLARVGWKDEGTYTCMAREVSNNEEKSDTPTKQEVLLEVYAEAKTLGTTNGNGLVGETTRMSCKYQGKPLPDIRWLRQGKVIETDDVKYRVTVDNDSSQKEITSFLEIIGLSHADNGTYLCHGENQYHADVAVMDTVVYDKPEVSLDLVKAVDMDKIYLNWTTIKWNSPVTDYYLSFRTESQSSWQQFSLEKISTDADEFVMRNLTPGTSYFIQLSAQNKYGKGEYSVYQQPINTLTWSPMAFTPVVKLSGITWNSISIRWNSPPKSSNDDNKIGEESETRNYLEYISYYKLTRKTDDHELNVYQDANEMSSYLWRELSAATNYTFTVSACNHYTQACGRSSNFVTGITEDGLSGPPSRIIINCNHDNISGMNFVDVEWSPPTNPNGQIEFYNIRLSGMATYINGFGKLENDMFGPEIKTVVSSSSDNPIKELKLKTRFDFLRSNTNYTVNVCAVTRQKECGTAASKFCKMRATPPRQDHMRRFEWQNDRRSGRDIFKLKTPRLSERNGPICCLRVVVVRMQTGIDLGYLPPQDSLKIVTFRQAHASSESSGAYVAEILGPNFLGHDVFIGDGQNTLANLPSNRVIGGGRSSCRACQTHSHAHLLTTVKQAENKRFARNVATPIELVEDGFLDPNSNYTAFVEVIVPNNEAGRSPYMVPRKPGEAVYHNRNLNSNNNSAVNSVLIGVLGVLAGLVTVALFLLLALVFLRRYSKQVAAAQGGPGAEMDLRRSFRHFVATLRGGRDHSQYLITPNGEPNGIKNSNGGHGIGQNTNAAKKLADLPPMKPEDLVPAYLERHKDSDYGFQSEFELLPDGYPDRTTSEACDRPINRPKNRYPDIRCYDQTRVKLTPLPVIVPPAAQSPPGQEANSTSNGASAENTSDKSSVTSDEPKAAFVDGSDYINANFVNGYKNRKLWICAQGPLEYTVPEFWRMVYEQGSEMIIMLTNLEEYNRVKCAQYWPGAGDSNYVVSPNCLINVGFCTEQRYSDYIVRELNMTVKTQKKDDTKATTIIRKVRHYHYLQWKDFNAPEHAPAMLRFVKRINEQHEKSTPLATSIETNENMENTNSSNLPPIVVHCSAGVGRSGTLIAIDSLMEQLKEEGQISIYKTVCELRHQRNYLVQSVKQYIFVYRAIMEMAQFGDTEIESAEIKKTWMALTHEEKNKKCPKLEQEFAKLANIVDDRKALSVGTNEENHGKNQTEKVIPFDRNRVILTPDGLRPHSTYINASFIEGYHNDESFIITQDPMESTVEDFWRMVTEHSIKTLVQLTAEDEEYAWPYYPERLSSNGNGPNFAEYGAMRVSLDAREDLPSYVKRDFTVYNSKADDTVKLTHFSYGGWKKSRGKPSSPSSQSKDDQQNASLKAKAKVSNESKESESEEDIELIPENSHGLLDLIEHATAHKIEMRRSGPIAVHCRYGSDRSSVYVALSCLVQQLKTESRADVFTVVRKLRSQRQGMIQNVSQYKFIYRAISDYVDLYRSKDDEEYQYSIPINSVNSICRPNVKKNGPSNGSIKSASGKSAL